MVGLPYSEGKCWHNADNRDFTPSFPVWSSNREAKPHVGQTFSFRSAERLDFRWKREAQLLRTTGMQYPHGMVFVLKFKHLSQKFGLQGIQL